LLTTHPRAVTSPNRASILLNDTNKEAPVVVYDSWAIVCFFGAMTASLAKTRSENAGLLTLLITYPRAVTSPNRASLLLNDTNKEDPVVVYDSWTVVCFFGAMTASLSTRMLGYRHWFLTYPRL
jgi:hypothetical protein